MYLLSIIIPTRNEEGNVKRLIDEIQKAKIPIQYEIIVVDDSDDATAKIAESLGARVVQGQHKGLGQAIVDGINNAQGDVVLVMDSDLSHNPKAIPSLLKPILEQGCELVIGSRYVKGGDYSNWALDRKIKSIIGVKLMQMVTGVRDSNSGFFCFRRSIIKDVELKPRSWKIMLEVLFKGDWISKQEVPIRFDDRKEGVSKNSNAERVKHAQHLLRLLVWKFRRYITFACVGGIGAIWYFSILYVLTEYANIWYGFSAIIGTAVAITNNYLINHFYTFRHRKEQNKNLFKGWLKYVANSGIGDGLDCCALILLTEVFGIWYMLSAFLASGVASVIKYTIAKKWIWGKKGRSAEDSDYEWMSFYRGQPWQKIWKQLIARITRRMVGEGGSILDVGCGASPCGVLVEHSRYVGIDSNKSKIDYMNSKKLKNAIFVEADMKKIPYKDKTFDTVICIEVIEHALNWDEAVTTIRELARVVKDGGKVVVATPNFFSLTGQLQDRLYKVFQPKAYADGHIVKFGYDSLVKLCQGFGLKPIDNAIPMRSDMVCLFRKESDIEKQDSLPQIPR